MRLSLEIQDDIALAGNKVWILSNVDFMQWRGPPPKDTVYSALRINGFCSFTEPTEFAQWHIPCEWHPPYIPIAPWQCDPPRLVPCFSDRNGVLWYRLDFRDCDKSNNNMFNFEQLCWTVGNRLCAAMDATWASVINDTGFWKLFQNSLLHGCPKDTARRMMHAFVQLSKVGLQREKFHVVFGHWQAGMHKIYGWNLMWQTRTENGRHAVKEHCQGRPSPSPADTEVQGVLPAWGVYMSDREIATLYAQDRLPVWFVAPHPESFRPFGKRLCLTNFVEPELQEHVLR